MKNLYWRVPFILFVIALTAAAAWCGYKIHKMSEQHADLKKDYSVVNGVGNGLLSVDVWREQIIEAADYQISHLKLTKAQRDSLEFDMRKVLYSVADRAEKMLDKKQKTIGGKIKKFLAKTFINEDKVRRKIPEFANTIVDELLKKKNKDKLKYLVESKLKEIGATTYDSTQHDVPIKKIMAKYDASDVESFNTTVEKMSRELKHNTYVYAFIVIGILVLFVLLWWLLRNQQPVYRPFFIVSVILAMAVLLTGLTTPMIEIDARIKSLDFYLMGSKVSFHDQVIFFQSKSIVDVVEILLKTHKYDSILVGILILVFSIVFPISKLFSTGIYLLNDKLKKNKIIQFFAFKSGKWSMADVNVIAIFMAYIGFKGILDDQLSNLNIKNDSLTSISTNQTSLQPGYILFVGFVLFGLVLSLILERITKKVHATKSK